MRNPDLTKQFYCQGLDFTLSSDYGDYLIVEKDNAEIHFFAFKELDIVQNYGQIYIRCTDIESLHDQLIEKNISIHPGGPLQVKPWGQKEFSILDPDNNLLTFGQSI